MQRAVRQEQGNRVNTIAPGPGWTPLNPADQTPEKIVQFGQDTSYEYADGEFIVFSDGDLKRAQGKGPCRRPQNRIARQIDILPALKRLSQKGEKSNQRAFQSLTIQALTTLHCFDLHLLRQPLNDGVLRANLIKPDA